MIFQIVLKFKQTNQICIPLKISQSINFEWHNYDKNNQDISSSFYESKKTFLRLMKREKVNLKKQRTVKKCIFLSSNLA